MSRQRDDAVDHLRGVAVVTMIAANLSARALADHPLWFRLYGSFAAPLFVLLAGMMIAKTHTAKKRSFRYFALRGLAIVAGGAFIDMFFEGIYPFTSMDVLYLLGLSLPLGYLCCCLPTSIRWGLVLALFAAAPILQHALGYTGYPTEYDLASGKLVRESRAAALRTSIANHVLIDGWFPLVPWFGFTVLGINLAGLRWRPETRSFAMVWVLVIGAALVGAGIVLALTMPVTLTTRGGYSEMFYPPTISYLLVACGVTLLLFWTADLLPHSAAALGPLLVFGQTALFTYFLHRGIISLFISQNKREMPAFLLVYGGLLLFCLVSAYAYRWTRAYVKEMLD